MNYMTMKFEDILAWCKQNNQTSWLKAKVNEQVKDKETGELRDITFIEVKRAFCEMFMADIIPVAKAVKKPTMKDIMKDF